MFVSKSEENLLAPLHSVDLAKLFHLLKLAGKADQCPDPIACLVWVRL